LSTVDVNGVCAPSPTLGIFSSAIDAASSIYPCADGEQRSADGEHSAVSPHSPTFGKKDDHRLYRANSA
jgi:hypothetical protein